MTFKFKDGETIDGTILVRAKTLLLIRTADNEYALININSLDNTITTKDNANNNEQSKSEFDSDTKE